MTEVLGNGERGVLSLDHLGIPSDATIEQARQHLDGVFGVVQGREGESHAEFVEYLRRLPGWRSSHEVSDDSFDVSNVVQLPDGAIVYVVMSGEVKDDSGNRVSSYTELDDETTRQRCIREVVESEKSIIITEYYSPLDVDVARLMCPEDGISNRFIDVLRRHRNGIFTQMNRPDRFTPSAAIRYAQQQATAAVIEQTFHSNQGYSLEQEAEMGGGSFEERLKSAKAAADLYAEALDRLADGYQQGLRRLVEEEVINDALDSFSVTELLEYARMIQAEILEIEANTEEYLADIDSEIVEIDATELQDLIFTCDIRAILADIDVDEFRQYESEVRNNSQRQSLFVLVSVLRDALIGRARDNRDAITYFRRAKNAIEKEHLHDVEEFFEGEKTVGEIDKQYIAVIRRLYECENVPEISVSDIREATRKMNTQAFERDSIRDGDTEMYAAYILDEIKKNYLYRIVRGKIRKLAGHVIEMNERFEDLVRAQGELIWGPDVIEILNGMFDASRHRGDKDDYIRGLTRSLPPDAALALQRGVLRAVILGSAIRSAGMMPYDSTDTRIGVRSATLDE